MSEHNFYKALLVFAIVCIISGMTLMAVGTTLKVLQKPEKPHRHKDVAFVKVGIHTYYVTYCYDTKMQVNEHDEHFESERAIKYFENKND